MRKSKESGEGFTGEEGLFFPETFAWQELVPPSEIAADFHRSDWPLQLSAAQVKSLQAVMEKRHYLRTAVPKWFTPEQKEGTAYLRTVTALLLWEEIVNLVPTGTSSTTPLKRAVKQLTCLLDRVGDRYQLIGKKNELGHPFPAGFTALFLLTHSPEVRCQVEQRLPSINVSELITMLQKGSPLLRSGLDELAWSCVAEIVPPPGRLLTLPSTAFSQAAMNDIYSQLGAGAGLDDTVSLSGIADTMHRVYVAPKGVGEKIVAHEENHLLYPGVRLGHLGTALNEGLTQWLVERGEKKLLALVGQAFREAVQEVFLSVTGGGIIRCYPHEVELIDWLAARHPSGATFLRNLYCQGTVADVKAFLGAYLPLLKNRGMRQLLLAQPQAIHTSRMPLFPSTTHVHFSLENEKKRQGQPPLTRVR